MVQLAARVVARAFKDRRSPLHQQPVCRVDLALVISTANSSTSNIQPVDICVTLLLTFGYYLFLVPLFAWRIVKAGNARLDLLFRREVYTMF